MSNTSDLLIKFREKIANDYIQIQTAEIPTAYEKKTIDYQKEEIDKYSVIFWHRLLRRIYEKPNEIECITENNINKYKNIFLRKTNIDNDWETFPQDDFLAHSIQSGDIQLHPSNWKYFLSLPSGYIIELGTKDLCTSFYIALIYKQINNTPPLECEVKKFINTILQEAKRLNKDLFHLKKEFERTNKIKRYDIFNVYLSNYKSGDKMFSVGEPLENSLRNDFLKYDARTDDYEIKENVKFIDDSLLTCGMFFCSSICYYFMAIEGFINIIYHTFLKEEYRQKQLNTEQRLDLEQKLRFITSLCNGFKESNNKINQHIEIFQKLKKYRNIIFHSKIIDSMTSLYFIEDEFLYTYNIDLDKNDFFTLPKTKINDNHVIEFKNNVDKIINSILSSMNNDTREKTEKYILREAYIPFHINKNGITEIG